MCPWSYFQLNYGVCSPAGHTAIRIQINAYRETDAISPPGLSVKLMKFQKYRVQYAVL